VDEVAEEHLGEFAGQGADGDLFGSTAAVESWSILFGQRGAGLKLEPAPGELDHEFAQGGVAATHALGFLHGAALVRHGGKAEVGAECLLVLEAADVADKGDEDGCGFGADAKDVLEGGREALAAQGALFAQGLECAAAGLGRLGGRIGRLPGVALVFDALTEEALGLAAGAGEVSEFFEEVAELSLFHCRESVLAAGQVLFPFRNAVVPGVKVGAAEDGAHGGVGAGDGFVQAFLFADELAQFFLFVSLDVGPGQVGVVEGDSRLAPGVDAVGLGDAAFAPETNIFDAAGNELDGDDPQVDQVAPQLLAERAGFVDAVDGRAVFSGGYGRIAKGCPGKALNLVEVARKGEATLLGRPGKRAVDVQIPLLLAGLDADLDVSICSLGLDVAWKHEHSFPPCYWWRPMRPILRSPRFLPKKKLCNKRLPALPANPAENPADVGTLLTRIRQKMT